MRRGWFGIILLALLMIPALALAVPATPYPHDTMLLYPTLTATQQTLFDRFYQAARRGETQVALPEETLYTDAVRALEALEQDCPELCAMSEEYSVFYRADKPEQAVYVRLQYIMPVSCQDELIAKAWALADYAYGSELERELFLHDRLCWRVVYDREAEYRHTAWGALAEGRAVCDGYARAMTLLWRMSYLRCGVVYGKVKTNDGTWGGHAWNIVRIRGQWSMVDATSNDQDKLEILLHWYFNVSDADIDEAYCQEERWELPTCTAVGVSWYDFLDRMVTGEEDMEDKVMDAFYRLAIYDTPVHLRFAREEDYLSLMENFDAWMDRYQEQAEPWAQLAGAPYTMSKDFLRCIVIGLN